MKVTIETILEETSYAPTPGTQYEVAEGVTVKMKRAYLEVQEEFEDKEEEIDKGFADIREEARQLQEKRQEAGSDDAISEEDLQRLTKVMRQMNRAQRKADIELAKLVTKGEWPERVIPRVASRIVKDFRTASTPTVNGQAS